MESGVGGRGKGVCKGEVNHLKRKVGQSDLSLVVVIAHSHLGQVHHVERGVVDLLLPPLENLGHA